MIQAIRSWLPSRDWARAAADAIRTSRLSFFVKWSLAIVLIGLLTGAMAVILPPMASIGLVALIAVVLLWALPELKVVPDRLLRKMFFVMVAAQLCVPAYYAIDTGYLPWISVRRICSLIVIFLFCLTVSGSQAARTNISETLKSSRLLSTFAIGFLVMIFLSIFTSISPAATIKEFSDALLNWYVPLFACILVVRNEEDVILLLKVIAIAAMVDAALGLLEFILQRRYYFDIFPQSLLDSMLASNPALATIFYRASFRNLMYRASSIYSVPLSFGELAAMAAPIAAYFFLHGRDNGERVLGLLSGLGCLVALITSGARGGFIAVLVSMPILLVMWIIRHSKLNPASMAGAIVSSVFVAGFVALVGLIFTWGRLYNMVLGGGDTVSSDNARFIQWEMAWPKVLSNPVTGHGSGMGADIVGYYTPGGILPTVDSYAISLIVEVGIPGLIFFFGMIVLSVWFGVKLYLTSKSSFSAMAGPIACSIVAFGVYRLVLSQRENHVLFFLIIGLVLALSRLTQVSGARESGHAPPRFNVGGDLAGNFRPR